MPHNCLLKTLTGLFSFEIPPEKLESPKTWGRGDPLIVLEIVNRTQIQARIIFKLKQMKKSNVLLNCLGTFENCVRRAPA